MTKPPATATQPPGKAWHSQSAEDVLAQLGSAATGLSATEAAKRLEADGPNELIEGQGISALQIFLGQFKSLIVWILIVAGIISGVLGEMVDAVAILAIVVLNAVIGFYQEHSAEKSIAALKKMTAPQAKVRRDGRVTSIPASGIVAGDILSLEAGDLVAADARLLAAASLKGIESALTGESEAVTKQPAPLAQGDIPLGDRGNMVFMGTSIAAGTGQAVVVATAMKTELGRIAGMMEEAGADEGTPLEKKLDAFGRVLVWAALGIVVLLFGLGWLRGTKPLELFMTSVSLAVAAVPEGLPAVVTVSLALGVRRMARRRALVRKLAAVETLGSTTVICTDKTGTLTPGEMTVRALYVAGQSYEVTGQGYAPEGEARVEGKKAEAPHLAPLLELATVILGCNNAHLTQEDGTWKTVGDPTEGALLVAGVKAGGDREKVGKELPKHHEIPFDSDRKCSTTIRKLPDGKLRAFINGAPDILLERCKHLLVRVPHRPDGFDLPLEVILVRMERAVGEYAMKLIRQDLALWETTGNLEAIEAWRQRQMARMFSLSGFIGCVKQRFTRWHNAKTGRRGTIWEERFGSVVVEEEERALRTMAAYIDLNPVRAGMVADPADYRWSGYAEAMAGKARARRGLVRIIGQMAWPRETSTGAQPWGHNVFPPMVETRALVFYRAILGGQGAARNREDGTVVRRGLSEKVRARLTTPNKIGAYVPGAGAWAVGNG